MPDRRQADRREGTMSDKKITIPFTTFIFSIVLIIIIGLSILIVIGFNRIGYNKGYDKGYVDGFNEGINYEEEDTYENDDDYDYDYDYDYDENVDEE